MAGFIGLAPGEPSARRRAYFSLVKVLCATGGDGYVSNELAATELLHKPYRAHELAHRIRTVLEGG